MKVQHKSFGLVERIHLFVFFVVQGSPKETGVKKVKQIKSSLISHLKPSFHIPRNTGQIPGLFSLCFQSNTIPSEAPSSLFWGESRISGRIRHFLLTANTSRQNLSPASASSPSTIKSSVYPVVIPFHHSAVL